MKRKVRVLAVLVAGSSIASVAAAQDAPATESAPAAAPAEPAPTPPPPPRGYPPPPPRAPAQQQGANQYPQAQYPQGQYPQGPYQYPPTYWGPAYRRGATYWTPPTAIYRPFSLSIGVGPGYLHGWGTDAYGKEDTRGGSGFALSYNLFRLNFAIVPNLSFWLGFEGTGTNVTSNVTGESAWLRQENWLLGLQYHFVPRLYLRGGMGAGYTRESTDSYYAGIGTGVAFAGAIGWEFVQTPHVALALDANGSVTKYSNQYWSTAGLNLAVTFY